MTSVKHIVFGLIVLLLLLALPAAVSAKGGVRAELETCEAELEACYELPCVIFPGDGWPEDAYPSGGVPLAYVDNGDGTFTDLNTGLIWEIKTDDGTIHDVDNRYTWTDASDGNYTNPDGTVFVVFLDALNATQFAGYDNWRLPTAKELTSLVDFSTYVPALSSDVPGELEPTSLAPLYWASTQDAQYTSWAHVGDFRFGGAFNRTKTELFFARAVRDAEPLSFPTFASSSPKGGKGGVPGALEICEAELEACYELPCVIFPGDGWPEDAYPSGGVPLAYVDNGDGTFTDLNTGLIWEIKTDDGTIHDVDNRYTWSSDLFNPNGTAFTVHLTELNDSLFAGYDDWRLPTAKEIHTLIDFTKYSPATPINLPGKVEDSVGNSSYWSSTRDAWADDWSEEKRARPLYFTIGLVAFGYMNEEHQVRAVRGP